MESLYVGQRELCLDLGLVHPLSDQRRGHSVLVQVEVADVVTQHNAAAEANSLSRREHGVGGEQGEGGN